MYASENGVIHKDPMSRSVTQGIRENGQINVAFLLQKGVLHTLKSKTPVDFQNEMIQFTCMLVDDQIDLKAKHEL